MKPINQNKLKERINQLALLLTQVVEEGYKDKIPIKTGHNIID